MIRTAAQGALASLVFLLLSFTLACSSLFGPSAVERDLAQTTLEIKHIRQINQDTQKTVEGRLKMFETRQQTQSDLILRTLSEVEQRVAALQESLGTIRAQIDELRYRTPGEGTDRLPIRVGQGDRASTVILEGEQLFLDGQKALQRKDFISARSSFQEFLKQFAGSARAAEAQMWIGEAFYRENKWNEAKATYQVVEQRYVTSPRVPEALYKMALCDQQMGQRDSAVAALERLIARYPRWEQIQQAQDMLARLGKVELQVPPGPPK